MYFGLAPTALYPVPGSICQNFWARFLGRKELSAQVKKVHFCYLSEEYYAETLLLCGDQTTRLTQTNVAIFKNFRFEFIF